jgi:uncharacterized cupin superfamily protein
VNETAEATGPADSARRNPRLDGAFGSTNALPRSDSAIDPGWLRTGTPLTRCDEHSSTVDGFAWTMVWDCTRGTFDWHYDVDEFVVILEGSVRVTDSTGRSHTLSAGDVGYFPAHTKWFWEVDHYVRKIAFCRVEVPLGLRFATRVARRLQRTVRPADCWRRLVHWLGHGAASLTLMGIPL